MTTRWDGCWELSQPASEQSENVSLQQAAHRYHNGAPLWSVVTNHSILYLFHMRYCPIYTFFAYAYAQKRAIIHAKVAIVKDTDKHSDIELATLLCSAKPRPLAPRKDVVGFGVQPCQCTRAQGRKSHARGRGGADAPHLRPMYDNWDNVLKDKILCSTWNNFYIFYFSCV